MIIITVALFEVLFMFYMKEYYYSMAKSYLEQQVRYTQRERTCRAHCWGTGKEEYSSGLRKPFGGINYFENCNDHAGGWKQPPFWGK